MRSSSSPRRRRTHSPSCSWTIRRSRSGSPRSPRPRARWAGRSRSPVGLRDILSGRKKLPGPKDDRLYALTTAAVTLDVELGLKTAGAGAITFKPQSSGEFRAAVADVDQLLTAVAEQCGS